MSFESALNAPGSAAPSHASAAAPPALAQRVADLFVRPSRLFEQLRATPVWAGPVAISIAVGILAIVAFPDAVFFESMQGATTRRGDPVAITSDPSVVALWERLRLSLGVLVTTPAKMLLLAAFLTMFFGRSRGGQADFRHFFALSAHVWLISAAGALLVLPFQLAAADPGIQLSAALLVPGLPALGAIGRAVAAIDPFTVWMLVVAGFGVAALDRRRARGPLLVLLGTYAAIIAALVGLGA